MENRGHEDDVATVLAGLACLQVQLGRPELAKLALDRALGNWRWKNNWVAMADAYSRLGNTYMEKGDFAAALSSYQEARQLRETQPTWNPAFRSWLDSSKPALSNEDLVDFASALGRSNDAEQYLRDAIRLLKELLPKAAGNSPSILKNKIHEFYLKIADIYVHDGNLTRSLGVVREAELFAGAHPLTFPGQFGQWGGAAERRGLILLQQKDYSGAERAFRAEIARWEPEKVIGTGGVSRLKMELAQALSLQGKHTQALEKIGEVLRFVTSSDIPGYRLHILLEYVSIALRASDKKQALALLAEARQLVDTYGILVEKTRLLRRIGDLFAALDEKAKAEEAYRAAMAVFESLLPRILDPTEAASFTQAQSLDIYHALAAHCFHQGKADEVLTLLERGMGQVLAQNIAQTYPDLSQLLAGEDARTLRKAHQDLTEAGFQIRTTIVDDTVPGAHQKALARWPEVNRRYIEVRTLMMARYPLYKSIQAPQPPTQKELNQLAKQNPDTLFVEWSVGEESTLCCTLSAQAGMQVRSLPLGKAYWHKKVSAWRAAILSESIKERQEEPSLATELGRVLLPELPRFVKRLVFVMDGPLQALPFAALRLPDGRRLIERCALRQTFSLGALMWEPTKKRSPKRTFCIAAANTAINAEASATFRGTTGFALKPLRFADQEVEQITHTLGAGKPLTGAVATEAAIRTVMQDSRIIHLAAHGVLLPENSLYSWLLLSESSSPDFDGRLEAREIAEMRLSAELVVLSACDTGLADSSGIQGMAWAFRAAGCPAVVATLWRVEDQSISQLMVAFYQGLRKQLPKDEALRQAQLKLLKNRVATWAGLTLFGENQPLSAAMASNGH